MFAIAASALTALLLAGSRERTVPPGMATIPAGTYAPLYGSAVHVGTFALDRVPATRGEFLAFVRQNPAWRRGDVSRSRADASYLADWTGDLAAGDAADLRRPVVNVSWYAANAYCEARGKRLPTNAEWERVAVASATRPDATGDPAFARGVLALYAARASGTRAVARGRPNVFGVSDLHALVWEWTADFAHAGHAECASAAIGATSTTNYPAFLRTAVRAALERTSSTQSLGFRCAA